MWKRSLKKSNEMLYKKTNSKTQSNIDYYGILFLQLHFDCACQCCAQVFFGIIADIFAAYLSRTELTQPWLVGLPEKLLELGVPKLAYNLLISLVKDLLINLVLKNLDLIFDSPYWINGTKIHLDARSPAHCATL